VTLSAELQTLLGQLVAIESVNPDLVASGSGEGNIAAFVAGWLRREGLEVEIVAPQPSRPSVVGVLRGAGHGPSLMLNAHMDTVGAGGMKDPFAPVTRDGRVYGRGAYDMKGSLAAIMLAAREGRALRLAGDLIVTAVADEEVASLGTSAVIERFRADAAIVTEPTELRLCLAHKGFVWLDVETKGVAAHGSRADIGVDAVAHAGRVLTGIVDLGRGLTRRPRHPLLGTGSIHASLIEGGQEMSTYPASCVIKVERRTIPGEDGATVLAEITSLIAAAREQDRDLVASAEVALERPPSEVSGGSDIARAVASAAGQALGQAPETIGVAYWMDMALLNSAGIPTVAFGPIGEGEHADVEWVDVSSLEACVRTYLGVAELVCGKV
jgi:acetylornithine deacetylase/succinyl-diaminopimelate desuccinylase family protein